MDRFDIDPASNYPTPRQVVAEFDAWLTREQTKAIERIAAALSDLDELANADIVAPDCGSLTLHDLDHAQYVAEKLEAARATLADAMDLARRAAGRA